jgi:ArsR family transcriptional regulator
VSVAVSARADLFRLLGDEDRLRLLALCAEEELTVGELAFLLGESQPQVTKKSQPLREAGLLVARRDGTRTLLKVDAERIGRKDDRPSRKRAGDDVAHDARGILLTGSAGPTTPHDPVIDAALEEGRSLCNKDGSLAKVARIVAQREELSRRLFEAPAGELEPAPSLDASLLAWAPLLAPLLPGHALAVDIGTGEGTLLPLLSPLYDRVIAVDRSAARLARCAARIASWGLPNVRLREGSVDDAALAEEILRFTHDPHRDRRGEGAQGDRRGEAVPGQRGGADLVVMARVLVHASRPQDAIASATRLLRPGGHLAIVDYLPHDDESLREQGHVWLGFEPSKLRSWLEAARLIPLAVHPFPQPLLQLAVARKPGDPHGHSH